MTPGPEDDDIDALREKIWLESGHVRNDSDRYWNLEHPRLWDNICKDFHDKRIFRAGGRRKLPLADDADDRLRWLKAGIRLVRVASRNGARRDLAGLWWWTHFNDSILSGGLLHQDKLLLVSGWEGHQEWYEKKSHLKPDPPLRTFFNIALGALLYETTVMCGVRYLESLAACVNGQEFEPWSRLFRRKEKNGYKADEVKTPQLNYAVEEAIETFDKLTYYPGLTKSDISSLIGFLEHLNQENISNGRAPTDVRYLRDSLHHGKFEISHTGGLSLDVYSHLLVNLFLDPQEQGRRGSTVHPYKFRQIDVEGSEHFLRVACSTAPFFFALYNELFFIEREGPKRIKHPPKELLDDAEERISEHRMTIREAQRAKEEARKARRRERERIQFSEPQPQSPDVLEEE